MKTETFDRTKLADLATGKFIDDPHNIILYGAHEDISSMAAHTLCDRIRQNGYSVSYLHSKHLIDLLNTNGRRKMSQALDHFDLVCIDDLSLNNLSYLDMHRVIDVIGDRAASGPLLIPTPYSLQELSRLFELFKAKATLESVLFRSVFLKCSLPLPFNEATGQALRATTARPKGPAPKPSHYGNARH